MIEAGELRPVVDRTFGQHETAEALHETAEALHEITETLHETADPLRYQDECHAPGKIVVTR